MIPHIIRAPVNGDLNAEGVLAGTERVVKVEHREETAPAALPSAPAATPPGRTAPVDVPPPGRAALLPPTQNPRAVTLAVPLQNQTVPQARPLNVVKPVANPVQPPVTPPAGGAKDQRDP
jgi:hypothetical protein